MQDYQLRYEEGKPNIKKYPICILANDMDMPMNIGSLFRMADALGVEKMYLCGKSPSPPRKKINRTARSTVQYVAHEYCENALETVTNLREAGYKIVSLEITKHSLDILDFEVQPDEKICLIIGRENRGVEQELLDASDAAVHIRMCGNNSSMNVAVATAIAVFEITKKMSC